MGAHGDHYVVIWLLQNTESGSIIWQRSGDRSMYFADFNKGKNRIRVKIESVQARPSTCIVIRFISFGFGEIRIDEPTWNIGLFGKKYDSKEKEEFAKDIKHLFEAISRQYFERRLKDMETEEERKEAIFRHLLNNS